MGLGDNLRSEVRKIIQEGWSTQDRRGVPKLDDLKLSNDAVTLRRNGPLRRLGRFDQFGRH